MQFPFWRIRDSTELCNKTYGFISYKQRIELDRKKDHDRDIRIATQLNSATQFLKNQEIECYLTRQ